MEKLKYDVLELLKEDARYSSDKIAVMLNKDAKEIKSIIKQLEEDGIIVKYSALVNELKTGDELVEAVIEVKVTPKSGRGFDAIAEEIYAFDEVRAVYLMSGAYDLQVSVVGKNLREVAMFVSEKLSTMDEVLSTATHFVLKKYKVDGAIFEENDDRGRMAVQP